MQCPNPVQFVRMCDPRIFAISAKAGNDHERLIAADLRPAAAVNVADTLRVHRERQIDGPQHLQRCHCVGGSRRRHENRTAE